MDEGATSHDEAHVCDACQLTRKRAKRAAYMREYNKRRMAVDPEYKARCYASARKGMQQRLAKDPTWHRDYQRNWREANREKTHEYSREWAERNPGHIRAKSLARPRVAQMTPEQVARARELKRASYYRNREKVLAREKERRALNPEAQRKYRPVKNARRRARLAQAEGKWTAAEFEALCIFYQSRCYYCGTRVEKPEAEHRIPVARGGSNDISNIVPACRPCNLSKATKTDDEFFAWLSAGQER